jgi:hypothetical protein
MSRSRRNPNKKVKAGYVASVSKPMTPKETDKIKDFTGDWVHYFDNDNNNFPNDLAKRSKRCAVHNAIIETKVVFTCGDGITFTRDGEAVDLDREPRLKEYVSSVNAKGESIDEIYTKAARDLITGGAFALQPVRNGDFFGFYHQDWTEVRSQKENKDHKVENYYISPDWDTINKSENTEAEEILEMLPAFEKGSREPNSILYVKEYTPEHRYYGLPDYVGALNWIDISYRIPKFNLDRFDNGFMPSAVVDLFGDAPEGMTAEQYIKDVVVPKFTGEGNNSKILFQMLDDETQKTNVQLFDNVKDGDFTVLQELADQNIISAHRWHPALSGIKSAGQLGNNQEIRNAFEIVKNTVIRGYQIKLNKAFDMMLEEAGFGDIKVSVHTKSPVSFIGDIDINSVLTTNEKREMLGLPPLEENEQTEQQEQENEE